MRILATLVLPFLFSCACSTSVPVEAGGAGFRSLERGLQSGIEARGVRIARDAAEWSALWAEHARLQLPRPPAPQLDFAREMALHVSAGPRPSAGFSIAVERVLAEGGKLLVEARETRPAPGAITAAVETAPFEIVLVPRSDAPLELRFLP